MKKILYIMRHGQTLFNQEHKVQGWCDSPLTDLGKKQAEVARDYFIKNNIKFDLAYSSTSERASDTLEIVTDFKMPYERVKGLKEWNFGRFEGKDESLNPPLPYKDFFKYAGGEGEMEFRERVYTTIKNILDTTEGETYLMVSHGAACVQFTRALQKNSIEFKGGFKNCSIFKVEYEDGVFDLVDLVQHDFSHLEIK